jgi:Ca2+-binding RTX toxin-like protein
MATEVEYALMAGRSYQSSRATINWLPDLLAQGWTEGRYERNDYSGFEAVSFQKGNEIVISFAGTGSNVDWWANAGGFFGVTTEQLRQAADYYLQVKVANPGATISLTGHSLGGGLASLMAVFFDETAVTFDQAPFRNSASVSVATSLKEYLLNERGYSESALQGLTNFISAAAGGGVPNNKNAIDFSVQGEILSSASGLRIGTSTSWTHGAPDLSGISLHSHALLTAFLQSDRTAPGQQSLSDVTFKLPDVVRMIFDGALYNSPTAGGVENFIERLVRHENGITGNPALNELSVAADSMLTRFTNDLWKLAQDGGLTMADDSFAAVKLVSQTLIAFAMQKYYTETQGSAGYNQELFTELSADSNGGIRFDLADVTSDPLSTTKGYSLYFHNYVANSFSPSDRDRIYALLPGLRDWYVQAGKNGMEATDTQHRGAFMLGGLGADSLTGGTGDDLLVGNAGHDRLAGGGGTDTLMGGAGFDTYSYTTGDGHDRIEDLDARGLIVVNGQVLLGGVKKAGHTYWENSNGSIRYEVSGTDLVVKLNGTTIMTVNENFESGQFGIRLVEEGSYAEATRTEFQKIDHYMQVGNLPDGTPIYEPVYVAFFDDEKNDTRITAPIGGLMPEIDDRHNLIYAGGGNDTVITAAGDDQVYGEGDDDALDGRGGHDRLYGGLGDDMLNGDEVGALVGGNDYLDGGEGDDVLLGHAGVDILLGGVGNDYLEGDDQESQLIGNYGGDYLDGGAGDDELYGVGGSDLLIGGDGNDFLLGDAALSQGGTVEAGGADSLDGGSGNDWLDGQFGDDVLAGGLDNDTLNGGDGSDVLYGGDAGDVLSGDLRLVQATGLYNVDDYRGAGGEDLLVGGAGSDYLTGGEGADTLFGDEGDDILVGDYDPLRIPAKGMATLLTLGGDDVLEGGEGNDTLKGGVGDDTLDGGIGNDILDGDAGVDQLIGGLGNDALRGGEGDDGLDGGEGDDALDGGAGNDSIQAGAGNDRLTAGLGSDTLYGEDGNDELISGNEYFDSGHSILIGGMGDDRYVVDSALDAIAEEVDAGRDSVYSFVSYTLSDHVENLQTFGATSTATGNALNNILRGGTVDGKAGDDTLSGIRYIFGLGYGHDTITDINNSAANNVVQFLAGVSPDQIQWQRSGNDLLISINGTTDTLSIPSFYTVAFNQGDYFLSSNIYLPGPTVAVGGTPVYLAASQIERFEFADGTVWGPEAFGGTMVGTHQANTYTFGRGAGHDTILDFDFTPEQPPDVLQMKSGVAPSDVIASRVGDNLVLGIAGTSDQLTVQSHFAPILVRWKFSSISTALDTYRIEQVHFADGTVWDAAAIANQLADLTGTEAGDVLRGNALANAMYGLGGNDWLEAFGGNDVLDGGVGNDTLLGGEGSDIYLFGRGSGSDIVEDAQVSGTDLDTIRLASDVQPDDVTFAAKTARDLALKINGSTDHLTLNYFLSDPSNRAIQVVFADGTVWDAAAIMSRATGLTLVGTFRNNELDGSPLGDQLSGLEGNDVLWGEEGNDVLIGGVGNDTLRGGAGHDTYAFNVGDGSDTIDDTAAVGEGNRIQFGVGIAKSDLNFTYDQVARTLRIQVGSSGTDQLVLRNFDPTGTTGSFVVETLVFADGSTLTMADLFPSNQAPTVVNPIADLTVLEDAPVSIQVPADTFTDQDMGDMLTYSAMLADGNSLPSWLSFDPATRTFSGTPLNSVVGTLKLAVTATDTGGLSATNTFVLTVQNVNDTPAVANALMDQSAAEDSAFSFTVPSTTFADEDAIHGDELTYSATLADGSSLPSWLAFNSGTRTFSGTPNAGDAGVFTIGVTATDSQTLSETDQFVLTVSGPLPQTLTGTAGNDVFTGGRGNDTLSGLAGNDQLTGGEGNDLLDGGTGTDTMTGGTGNDTYVVDNTGDVVTENLNEGTDTVQSFITYTLGANVENLTLMGTGRNAGIGNALNNVLTGNSGANLLDGQAGADQMTGGTGDDLYMVDNLGDVVIEQAGEGTLDRVSSVVTYSLSANVENLALIGTAAINGTGNSSDNVLTGNSAENVLTGLAGNDTYIIGAGDTVVEGANAGTDTVVSGITHSLGTNVENLTLVGISATNGTGNALDNVLNGLLNLAGNTLTGGAGNDTYIIGASDTVVEAAGGGTDTVQSLLTHTLGANVENLILTGTGAINGTGNSLNNAITGNSANNVLSGAGGNDQLRGGLGTDTVNGGSGDDTFLFGRGDGQDLVQENGGTADKLLYDSGINPFDLVLSRQANDLRLAIHGSSDSVTIQNWYTSPTRNQIETIQAGNGQQLLNSQVDQLIQAMATFTTQTGLTWDQAIDQRPTDVQAVLAGSWQ